MPNDRSGKDPPASKERVMEQKDRRRAARDKVAPETEPTKDRAE